MRQPQTGSDHSRLWLPSQNAPFFVCLQPHHAIFPSAATSVFNGVKDVVLWDPSQKGWLFDWPQVHHQ